ncbi:MAG: hypothetical protein JSU90_06635, partial [Nitrospiraceae bacterium]
MKMYMKYAALGLIILLTAVNVSAQSYNLDWGFNIDGTSYCYDGLDCTFDFVGYSGGLTSRDQLPPVIDTSGIELIDFQNSFASGLGTATVTIDGAGLHFVIFYVDQDLGPLYTDSTDENGGPFGILPVGEMWEVDEPGDGASGDGTLGLTYFGDLIQFNFVIDGILDNTIFFDALDNQFLGHNGDTAMALGWNFELSAGDTATISFTVSDSVVPTGFYLMQTDTSGINKVYLSSDLN